ncbi:ribonuclease H-like domain-containing protein [Tanacetum coccineum]
MNVLWGGGGGGGVRFLPPVAVELKQLAILTIPSFKDNCVVSRGVKRAFIYGKIEKEVYVCQPPGFKDPDFPDKVYKVEKALYGLHQASRAWQSKKQTVLLNPYLDAEYIAAFTCSRQVLIGLNQLLIMGLTFMHTKIYIDNESTICIVKNPIFHSKTEAHRDYAALHQDSNEYQYLIRMPNFAEIVDFLMLTPHKIHAKVDGKNSNIKSSVRRSSSIIDDEDVAQQADMGEGSGQPTDPQHTSTSVQPSNEEPITVPSSSQPKKTHRPTKAKRATEISQSSRLIPCSGSVPDTILRGCNKLRLRRRSLDEKDASKPGRNLKQGKQSSIFEESDFDNEGFDADIDEVFKDVEGDVEQYTAEPITTSHVIITTSTITPPITTTVFEDDNLTIDQTLMKTRSEKSKVRGVVMQEPKKGPDQVDEEIAQRLQARMQAKLEEEERLAREREEDANIAEWDNAQAMMDADYELATRIQAQEQEELTIEEKSRLIPEVVKGSKDRAKGSETRAEGSSKRAGEDLQQESTKKQRLI